jgi:phage gpG-like protein
MIRSDADALVKRVQGKLKVMDFKNRETAQKFVRIALLLENQTKINIRRRGLVDTGALLNSITSSVVRLKSDEARIEWGSVGVMYAAVHEFGLRGTINIPSHTRTRSGNTHNVRSHSRQVNFRERPYIRPSLVMQRRKILQILKGD